MRTAIRSEKLDVLEFSLLVFAGVLLGLLTVAALIVVGGPTDFVTLHSQDGSRNRKGTGATRYDDSLLCQTTGTGLFAPCAQMWCARSVKNRRISRGGQSRHTRAHRINCCITRTFFDADGGWLFPTQTRQWLTSQLTIPEDAVESVREGLAGHPVAGSRSGAVRRGWSALVTPTISRYVTRWATRPRTSLRDKAGWDQPCSCLRRISPNTTG